MAGEDNGMAQPRVADIFIKLSVKQDADLLINKVVQVSKHDTVQTILEGDNLGSLSQVSVKSEGTHIPNSMTISDIIDLKLEKTLEVTLPPKEVTTATHALPNAFDILKGVDRALDYLPEAR